jgi:phospholipase/carboxylesterase
MTFQTGFQYVFKDGQAALSPLLLLHGTGGNEHDLLGLAEAVAPGRSLLSPRGQVLENGMPRYFRRFAEGIFDEGDIRTRAADLETFVTGASAHHKLGKPIVLGFSNGANMAAAMLALYPDLFSGAALLRATAPFAAMPDASLTDVPVLLLSGGQDTMIPLAGANRFKEWLTGSGAAVTHEVFPAGHGLTQHDLAHMTRFLKNLE